MTTPNPAVTPQATIDAYNVIWNDGTHRASDAYIAATLHSGPNHGVMLSNTALSLLGAHGYQQANDAEILFNSGITSEERDFLALFCQNESQVTALDENVLTEDQRYNVKIALASDNSDKDAEQRIPPYCTSPYDQD